MTIRSGKKSTGERGERGEGFERRRDRARIPFVGSDMHRCNAAGESTTSMVEDLRAVLSAVKFRRRSPGGGQTPPAGRRCPNDRCVASSRRDENKPHVHSGVSSPLLRNVR